MAEKKSYYKKKGELKPKVEYKPKRGLLSKLMSEDEKATAGIHELSKIRVTMFAIGKVTTER